MLSYHLFTLSGVTLDSTRLKWKVDEELMMPLEEKIQPALVTELLYILTFFFFQSSLHSPISPKPSSQRPLA